MQFTFNVVAGEAAKRQQTPGRYFVLLDTGAAASVELRLYNGTTEIENIRTAKRGLKLTVPEGFTHVEIASATTAALEVVISQGRVDVGFIDGVQVSATIAGPLPVPVSNDRGTPGNLLHVAGVTLADAPAVAVRNGAAVAVTDAGAVLIAADAARRALRFTNIGTDAVAIGAAGITWAARCIVLEPGDVWIEDRAANLAWSGICAATKTASVTAQGITA